MVDFAEVVAADAAALADAGIPFLADPAGSVTLAVAGPLLGYCSRPTLLGQSLWLWLTRILFPADTAGILFPADTVRTDTVDVAFVADAEEVTVDVAVLADAGILFPSDPAGILFLTDAAGILFPADPAGILFPADPAGTAAADVAFLADVTDLADAGVVPLAAPDMTFPEIELVTGTVACEWVVTPMTINDNYGGLPGSEWADMWCGGEISRQNICPAMMVGLVQNDLLNGNSEDPREVFGDWLPAPMYPVIPERYGERECDDFGDDGYGYYEDFDSRSGSSEYDDPRDYREWDHWSDTGNAKQYWAPFPAEAGGDSVLTSCASVLAVDEAVIVTDSCLGDPRARRVLNGPEFRCDPDSDRMRCRLWIPSAVDGLGDGSYSVFVGCYGGH